MQTGCVTKAGSRILELLRAGLAKAGLDFNGLRTMWHNFILPEVFEIEDLFKWGLGSLFKM